MWAALRRGSPGYAAAALASGNYQVLFGPGQAAGNVASDSVPAGKLIAFYTISSGTTSSFLASNSANSSSGGPVAFFSFTSRQSRQYRPLPLLQPQGNRHESLASDVAPDGSAIRQRQRLRQPGDEPEPVSGASRRLSANRPEIDFDHVFEAGGGVADNQRQSRP